MFTRVIKKIWAIVRDLYAEYRMRMLAISALGIFSTFLEGLGISVLIPLIVFFVGGDQAGYSNPLVTSIHNLLSNLDITIGFKALLVTAVVLFMFKAFVLFCLGYLRAKTVARYRMLIRSKLYRGFLGAEFAYLQKQKVGHLDVVLMREVKQSSKLFDNLIGLILSLTSMVGYGLIAFVLSPYTTLLAITAGAFFLFIFQPAMKIIRRYSRELIDSGRNTSHFLAEILFGIKTVKTIGVESAVFEKAAILFRRFEKLEFRKQIVKHISKISLEPFSLFFILGLFVISYLYLDFNITTFVAVVYLIHQVFTQVDKIQSSIHLISETMPSAVVVLNALKEVRGRQESANQGVAFSFKRKLSLKNVSFRHQDDMVLSEINLDLKIGESIGVIGPSGAGKTTLIDLILRLHRPESGQIILDDLSSDEFDLLSWRRRIVYVPQDSFILNASIADNVKFFDQEVTDEDVKNAIRSAHLDDLINSLPAGLLTKVGERGSRLSGGERQRIALARALARRPSILILDEATSSLDAHTEVAIKEALKGLKRTVTIIVIAHKPSTIDYVDKIIALKDGKIVETGSPAELMERPDSYFRQIYDKGSALNSFT